MSLTHTVGFECEVHGADDEYADRFPDPLRQAGLWTGPPGTGHVCNQDCADWGCEDDEYDNVHGDAHYNHCGCEHCAWGASIIRPMFDSTCGAELVSDPLPWPSTSTEAILTQLSDILLAENMVAGPSAGFHIHVERDGSAPSEHALAWFAWYEYAWSDFACQSLPGVRVYNAWLSASTVSEDRYVTWEPASPLCQAARVRRTLDRGTGRYKGPTLSVREQTFEFRIWNSVVEAWRMHMAIEMSCAFLDAVEAAGPFVAPTAFTPLVDFLAPYLSDEGLGYMLRHLADRKAYQ